MLKLRLTTILLAVACVGVALGQGLRMRDAERIARRVAPGAEKYSRPLTATRDKRDVWVVEATKNGTVRTITIDRRTGRVLANTVRNETRHEGKG